MQRFHIVPSSLALLASLLIVASDLSGQWTPWQTFATLYSPRGEPMVVLEWQARPGDGLSYTSARWRVTNQTTQRLWDVSIGRKTYICSSGMTVTRGGEMAGRGLHDILDPGESDTTFSDSVGPAKECPAVNSAELSASSAVRFSLERGGVRKDWSAYGTVR